MRPFMYEESDWVLVNDDLHKETQKRSVHVDGMVTVIISNIHMFRHVCVFLNVHTLRMKSGGVPGLTVGLRTPSW